DLRLRPFGEVEKPRRVAATDLVFEFALLQTLERVLANRREHAEPRRAVVARAAQQEALVAERRKHVERAVRSRSDVFDGFERGAVDERREGVERRRLLVVE